MILLQITGGGNGIGREIALRLAKEGCSIAIVDIDSESGIKMERELSNLSVKAKAYCVSYFLLRVFILVHQWQAK